MRRRLIGLAAALGFIGSVVAANWLVENYGVVPVGFGLVGPAGVFVVGAAFLLRDATQEGLGRLAVLGAIAIGAGLSWLISPVFATASAAAFAVSELADFAIYTPLRERQWTLAVLASNIVGAVVDSALFLWLAFGSLAFFWGQVIGKLWVTAAAVLVMVALRARLRAAA